MSPSIQTQQAGEGDRSAALGLRQLELMLISTTGRAWTRSVPWTGLLEQMHTCLHMWAAMPWTASALVRRSSLSIFWFRPSTAQGIAA